MCREATQFESRAGAHTRSFWHDSEQSALSLSRGKPELQGRPSKAVVSPAAAAPPADSKCVLGRCSLALGLDPLWS